MTEPPRPTEQEARSELADHVKQLAGPDAVPRPEQVDAVMAIVMGRQRTLLVARTGFGKSAVYFSSTRMLRDRGWGPTIVISPLLALMRDQVEAAERLGLKAVTINSSNIDAWDSIEDSVSKDVVDLILIAPERLANAGFRRRVFDFLKERPFALVCDEAHCISDWGHDFRPDYRRLRQLLRDLPSWTPVLATTATANARVTDDVAKQLGSDTLVLRTSLDRESLRLSVVDLPTDAHRLAWLSETLGTLEGSGIIYCLTVQQANITTDWLRAQGHDVRAYSGSVDAPTRMDLEQALKASELKGLVATSALGMGFDKGDMAFCIHFGLPPSPVAYYQQIGRAGRSLDNAEVIALPRPVEDEAVWRWFESVSMPSEQVCHSVLDQLDSSRSTSVASLETSVNLGRSRLGTLMNILEVDGAVERAKGGWILASNDGPGSSWEYDHQGANNLRSLRRAESEQMRNWASLETCRLRYLREALDDMEAVDCGRCDRCTGNSWNHSPDPLLIAAADEVLRGGEIVIEPRKQWPTGLAKPKGRIKADRQYEQGRALSRTGDGGWSPIVEGLLESTSPALPDEMVNAIVRVLKVWEWSQRPMWICPMPSRRHQNLIDSVSAVVGELGKLPVYKALRDKSLGSDLSDTDLSDTGLSNTELSGLLQADQSNSAHQLANVWDRLSLDEANLPPAELLAGAVLLVDDVVSSRWTMTTAGWLLSEHVQGPVLPFALRSP